MPDDPAWLHSGLCLDTGSPPNHGVNNIPSTPIPASRCLDRPLKPERKPRPASCRSRFPPRPSLHLLPFLRLCPSHIRRISSDLSPLFRRQKFHLGFGGFSA